MNWKLVVVVFALVIAICVPLDMYSKKEKNAAAWEESSAAQNTAYFAGQERAAVESLCDGEWEVGDVELVGTTTEGKVYVIVMGRCEVTMTPLCEEGPQICFVAEWQDDAKCGCRTGLGWRDLRTAMRVREGWRF